jgi:hypothetical protein
MKVRSMLWAATAALWIPAAALAQSSYGSAAPGVAAPGPSSALAMPLPDLGSGPVMLATTPADELVGPLGAAGTTLEAIHYRPRGEYRPYRSYAPPILSQLHVGFFDPKGDETNGFVVGFRAGPQIDPNVQLGLGLDWEHKSSQLSEVIGQSTVPGVGNGTISADNSNTTVDFIPIMGFVQVSANENMTVIPYGGIGGGYEVLTVSADLSNGDHFDATYGGWGWQVWGGAAVPLSGRSRLFGEIYLNQANVSRDFNDPTTGQPLRETVNRDGVGGRFGVSWGF